MASNVCWDYYSVRKLLASKGYILLDKEYKNVGSKLTFKDTDEYYYYQSLTNFIRKKQLRFSTYNPYTVQNIKLWCKLNNKPFKLISKTYTKAINKLQWECFVCGDIFQCEWSIIQSGSECGVCRGFQVGKSNCLANKNPNLALQWHPTQNGSLTPYDVTANSNKKVWWICEYEHEWKTGINNRSNGTGCPYCAGQLPSEENNLLKLFPDLCMEWDYNQNAKFPNLYTPFSNKAVYWLCDDCGHGWKDTISHRTLENRACPNCNVSRGEKRVKDFLMCNHIQHESQVRYNGLVGINNGNLSYDFYLPIYNCLIEYQGEYHDGTARNQTQEQFKIQQEHDRRKREYAQNNNIKLLEIWYWDFDNIEEILSKHLAV